MDKAQWAERAFQRRWDATSDEERNAAWTAYERYCETRACAESGVVEYVHFHDLPAVERVAWVDAVSAATRTSKAWEWDAFSGKWVQPGARGPAMNFVPVGA